MSVAHSDDREAAAGPRRGEELEGEDDVFEVEPLSGPNDSGSKKSDKKSVSFPVGWGSGVSVGVVTCNK